MKKKNAALSPSEQLLAWSQQYNRPWLIALLIGFIYFLSRLFYLTALPVFADESIYIRWAQLIQHSSEYLFFSVNDGKPPLFIWSLIPSLSLFSDPLWAGRFVGVLVGFGQLIVSDRVLHTLGANKQARLIQAILILITPFWFFHHRMALMDGMLVLWLSLSWWGLLMLNKALVPNKPQLLSTLSGILLAGLGWGLALWTKTPALFLAGVFVWYAYFGNISWITQLKKPRTWQWLGQRSLIFGLAGLLGLSIFALLRVFPAFGSLFGRSSDFTFTVNEVLTGQWRTSLDNINRFFQWMSTYMRPELLSLPFIALALSQHRHRHVNMLVAAFIMAVPFFILGKTVHPRYYLPIAPFLTASAALFFTEIWTLTQKTQNKNMLLVGWLLILSFLIGAGRFMLLSYLTPNQTPFVLADREQYLTSWASGHGIVEVRDMMIEYVQDNPEGRLTVVTEGSFGTLPDALLLYFDQRPEIQQLKIEGLAQYPVTHIPDWVWAEAQQHPVWLVVNEDRMEVLDDRVSLIARYPRPYGAPELQVYSIGSR
jgi:4-amino-4-deoxy-L-arabinose transferase-like glycosyltransferase